MKSFVSSHAKKFKASQVNALSSHHKRELLQDENVFPELSSSNLYLPGKYSFSDLEKQMVAVKTKAGKKSSNLKFRKDANVMLDNVVSLSLDRVEQLKLVYPEDWKQKILDCCVQLANDMQKTFGLTPYSIDLHLDEGHTESGKFLCNPHAHISFFNFDFKELVQPLRKMKRTDFSKLQDMSADAFKELGFERGQKRAITGKSHLDKNEYVLEQLALKNKELELLKSKTVELESKIQDLLKSEAQAKLEIEKTQCSLIQMQRELAPVEDKFKHLNLSCGRAEHRLEKILKPTLRHKEAELEKIKTEIFKMEERTMPNGYFLKQEVQRLTAENIDLKKRFGVDETHQNTNFTENLMQNKP
jgi:hypothetical protein